MNNAQRTSKRRSDWMRAVALHGPKSRREHPAAHYERAENLRRSLWGLIERSGFREYYEPFTGQRFGARDFTWSGLLST